MIKKLDLSGVAMFVDDTLELHRQYIDRGLGYEPHMRKELERLAPAANVFWDIGANAGIHTVSAKQINSNLRVICFEPMPSNYQMLLRTIAENGWGDVGLIPLAVGAICGTVSTYPSQDNVVIRRDGASDESHLMRMVTLDSLNLPLPDLVKIDVEGCECEALEHARKLMEHRPVFLSEYSTTFFLQRGRGEELTYLNLFFQRGYRVTVLDYRPGMRREFKDAKALFDYVQSVTGFGADILCEPL